MFSWCIIYCPRSRDGLTHTHSGMVVVVEEGDGDATGTGEGREREVICGGNIDCS